MTQKQILNILQKLIKENRIEVSENVLNSYINGRTRDKFDPKFMISQSLFNSEVLLECLQIGTFKQGLPKTFTLTRNYQSLYNSNFDEVFEELKVESKTFEKKLKEKDKGVSFFRKFEVSFDVSRKIYVPHYHYLIISELETEEIEDLSAICTYAKELSVVSKKKEKTSIERVASYLAKQFITLVKDFNKNTWSGFELGKNDYGTIKKFIEITYNALKNESIYKYFGDYQKIYQKHLEQARKERKEYCERVLNESKGDEKYFRLLSLKQAREKKEEKRQEDKVNKAIAEKRKKRVKEYRALSKAMFMNLREPKIDREKLLDYAYIAVSELYKIDRQDEVFNSLFRNKEKEGGNEMARTRDKSEDYRNQLKLFKSRDEIEKEEKARERKQWLDEMEDFFTPDVNEVRQEIQARKERVKLLRELAVILFQFDYRTATESKIRLTVFDFLIKAYKSRLNRNICLKWFENALELIAKIRLGLSIRLSRTQERKYERGKREKVKKVVRPPPYKIVPNLLIKMELF